VSASAIWRKSRVHCTGEPQCAPSTNSYELYNACGAWFAVIQVGISLRGPLWIRKADLKVIDV